MTMNFRRLVILMLWVVVGSLAGYASEKEYGVYEFVVRKTQGQFDQLTSSLQNAATQSGWSVVATHDPRKKDDCAYKARVNVFYHAD